MALPRSVSGQPKASAWRPSGPPRASPAWRSVKGPCSTIFTTVSLLRGEGKEKWKRSLHVLSPASPRPPSGSSSHGSHSKEKTEVGSCHFAQSLLLTSPRVRVKVQVLPKAWKAPPQLPPAQPSDLSPTPLLVTHSTVARPASPLFAQHPRTLPQLLPLRGHWFPSRSVASSCRPLLRRYLLGDAFPDHPIKNC